MMVKRGDLWWLTVSWLVLAAACCLYRFIWSTFPYVDVDEPPGPGTVTFVGEISLAIGVLLALGWIPLLIAGAIGLRNEWRRAAAWTPAGAAGLALQVSYLLYFGTAPVTPIYSGPAVIDWVFIPETAGLVLAGLVMACAVSRLPRSDRSADLRAVDA